VKQLNAFDVPFNKFSLVEASAGTGKTYNITSLYIRAIVEKDLQPSSILVLTYTEAATAELKSRIRIRIKECIHFLNSTEIPKDDFLKAFKKSAKPSYIKKLKRALFSFDEASVFTIHGFCQKLLREESLAFGIQPDFEIIQDTTELVQDAVDSYWRSLIKEYSGSKFGKGMLEFVLSEKLNPDNLRSVINKVLSKPYAELLPNNISHTKIDKKKERLKSLKQQIADRWEKDHEVLKEIIYSGKLNKRSYKKETFQILFKTLENWVKSDIVYFSVFDKFENFGKTILEKRTTNGNEVEVPELSVLIDNYLLELQDLDDLKADFLLNAVSDIRTKIERQKEINNGLTFDDLIQKVESQLTKDLAKKIATQYPIALVDEFQDTDPIQYSIFKQIYKDQDTSLFMIGDPKQAIYSFRGADLFTYFEATEDVQTEQQFSLRNNYRSNKELITAVNKVFARHEHPFVFERPSFSEAFYPENKSDGRLTVSGNYVAPLSFIECNFEDRGIDPCKEITCRYVASQIKILLSDRCKIGEHSIRSKDIAILVRKKKEAVLIQQILEEEGIKSITRSNQSVFNTEECADLKLILKAIIDHSNQDLIRAALSTSFIGYTSTQILELNKDDSKWGEIIELFRNADQHWIKYGFLEAFNTLNKFFGITVRLSALQHAERRLTNLYHLQELIGNHEVKNRTSSHNVLKFLNQKMSDGANPPDEELIRLESDDDLVTITTLHSSKGLEYPIVFIPFLWDKFESKSNQGYSLLEYHDSTNKLNIDLTPRKNDPNQHIARKELLADTLRLCYVALTRAETACFIPFGNYKDLSRSSLLGLISGYSEVLKNEDKEAAIDDFYTELNKLCLHDEIQLLNSQDVFEEPKATVSIQNDLFSRENYSVEKFNRHDIGDFSRIVSFSSLTDSKSDNREVKDYDQLDFTATATSEIEEAVETLNRFNFPKGAITGNLLHNIFEHISFKDPEFHSDVINSEFEASGLDKKWLQILKDWISEGLEHKLVSDIKLSSLNDSDTLKELEFHFPVDKITTEQILGILRDDDSHIEATNSISGFMKGFVDLIFRHEGKYYILDYKSNYLGDSLKDYESQFLKEKIVSSNFDVQYHIYTLALILFLGQRNADFDYERDFGGVFYMFLRGLDSSVPGSGVFFDKPDKNIIQELGQRFGVID
jgi:exodeoxyribonuclease V beta subunit